MTTTSRFSTGGGFPYDYSPSRTIDFTLSWGRSDRFGPHDSRVGSYGYQIQFSDPNDSAYVCAMYGPPRDEAGLNAFVQALSKAYADEDEDPANRALPVPPLSFGSTGGANSLARNDVYGGRVEAGCRWAQRFGSGVRLGIDLSNGASSYLASATDGHRVLGEHLGSLESSDSSGIPTVGVSPEHQIAQGYDPRANAPILSRENDSRLERSNKDRDVRGPVRRLTRYPAMDDSGEIRNNADDSGVDGRIPSPPEPSPGVAAPPAFTPTRPIRYLTRSFSDPSLPSVQETGPNGARDQIGDSGETSKLSYPDRTYPASLADTFFGPPTSKPRSQWVLPLSALGRSERPVLLGADVPGRPSNPAGSVTGQRLSPADATDAVLPSAPTNGIRPPDSRNTRDAVNSAPFSSAPSDLAAQIASLIGIDRPAAIRLRDSAFQNVNSLPPWLRRALEVAAR